MKIPQGVYEENGYTKIRIWLGPKRNPDGTENKPYRRSMGHWSNETIQKAKNHIDEVRRAFEKGFKLPPEPKPLSVTTACDLYYERHWLKKRGRTVDGIRNVGYKLKVFKAYWRTCALHMLLPKQIEHYMAWRKGSKMPDDQPVTGAQCEPVSDGTIDNELNILSSLFAMIEKWQERREIGPYLLPTNTFGVPFNPVEYVERDSLIETKRERVASRDELVKVKEYCDANDPDMLIMIERAICTGLRKTDLEKVNGLIDVRGVLSKTKERKLFRMPVDFSRRISYKNFDRRWDDLREACKMQDFHWHDWRATSATMLSLLGFTDQQVAQLLGHSIGSKITDGYIRSGSERLRPQVDALKGKLTEVWKDAQPAVPTDPTRKRCRGCGELKPLQAYGKHSGFKSGLDSRCRPCNYKRLVEQRRRNPNLRVVEYAKKRLRAVSSAVEHLPHTEGATGSSPVLPTISKLPGNGNSIETPGVSKSVPN